MEHEMLNLKAFDFGVIPDVQTSCEDSTEGSPAALMRLLPLSAPPFVQKLAWQNNHRLQTVSTQPGRHAMFRKH